MFYFIVTCSYGNTGHCYVKHRYMTPSVWIKSFFKNATKVDEKTTLVTPETLSKSIYFFRMVKALLNLMITWSLGQNYTSKYFTVDNLNAYMKKRRFSTVWTHTHHSKSPTLRKFCMHQQLSNEIITSALPFLLFLLLSPLVT